MRFDNLDLQELETEEAVIKLLRTCGENSNPVGYFSQTLAMHGNKADFKTLSKLGYIKITSYRNSVSYFGSWMQLTGKAKNLYNKVNINYRWDY
jgi:hypothetical protein